MIDSLCHSFVMLSAMRFEPHRFQVLMICLSPICYWSDRKRGDVSSLTDIYCDDCVVVYTS